MVMIFTLVSSAQEWLSTKSDQIKQDTEEAEERRIKEEEEAEQKRFEGKKEYYNVQVTIIS